MNDYKEVKFQVTPCSETSTDVLAAMLAEAGYESFVADNDGLTAYIKEGEYSREAVESIVNDFFVPGVEVKLLEAETIEGQDWNHEWEKNYFKPIIIGDQCVIHSSFHKDIPVCRYDIVIDPKMAFGTGHHATTSLIISQLLSLDLEGKTVVDMGTGTGILAILAAMRGAKKVTGIEIDEGAYLNALDNVVLNHTPDVKIYLGDVSKLNEVVADDSADLFLANINRNVITADIKHYATKVAKGGKMLLSGFYEEDVPIVEAAANEVGLEALGYTTKDRWTCLQLIRR